MPPPPPGSDNGGLSIGMLHLGPGWDASEDCFDHISLRRWSLRPNIKMVLDENISRGGIN